MAITLANLIIKVSADTSTLASDLGKVSGEAKTLGGRVGQTQIPIKKLAVGLTAVAAAGAGIAVVSTRILELGASVAEVANKFNVVMGPAAEEMNQRLRGLTETIPLMFGEMQALAAGIQDLLVPLGLVRSEAANMSVDMIKLAGDLASFNNVAADIPLEAIKSALAGQSRPLRRFGVDVSAARLEALALSEGIIRMGEDFTAAARAQAVMIAVQKDSSDAMGDAARTADSAANQLRFMRRDVRQLKEDLAVELIPVLLELVHGFSAAIERAGEFAETLGTLSKVAVEMGTLGLVIFDPSLDTEIAGIRRQIEDLNEAQRQAFLTGRLVRAGNEYRELHSRIEEAQQAIFDATPVFLRFGKTVEGMASFEIRELQRELQTTGAVMNEISRMMASGFEAVTDTVDDLAAALGRLNRMSVTKREVSVGPLVPAGVVPITPMEASSVLSRPGGLGPSELDAFARSIGNVSSAARGATDGVSSVARGFEMIKTEGASTADKILGAGGIIGGVLALGQAAFGAGQDVRAAAFEMQRAMESLSFSIKDFAGLATDIDSVISKAVALAREIADQDKQIRVRKGVDLEEAIKSGASFRDVFQVTGGLKEIANLRKRLAEMGLSLDDWLAQLEASWNTLTEGTADKLANLGDETEKTADAMRELAGILNAPRGFKVGLRRFQASAPEDMERDPAPGGREGGSGRRRGESIIVQVDGRTLFEIVEEEGGHQVSTGGTTTTTLRR